MTLPNFFVIGAGRSGTTSLHHYLGQHPEIFMARVKAPSHFYCQGREQSDDPSIRLVVRNYFVPDAADYEALFDGVRDESAIGEVSPVYLASVDVAPRIAAKVPEARLIAILRNPVDRAWARFVGRRRDGLEPREHFADVVRAELEEPLVRADAAGTYLASGCCHHVLATYLEAFPRGQIHLLLFEDLQEDAQRATKDIFRFLDIDDGFAPDMEERLNVSGGFIRNPLLRAAWTGSALWRARARRYLPAGVRDLAFRTVTRDLIVPSLDPDLRVHLTRVFRDDIEKLQQVLDRDLSAWMEE